MQDLIDRLKLECPETPTYEWLGEFVRSIDVSKLNFKDHLPELPEGDTYGRNILCLEPIECVLLYWPGGVESAVHLHGGFWGYVLCMEGRVDNHTYIHKETIVREGVVVSATPGGIVDEPDGTIHKITNGSKEQPLVTLHFYYPALETLDDLVLYNLEEGTLGVLNEKADAASFSEPIEHFKKFERDAFKFVPFENSKNAASHRIHPIIPKPSSQTIRELIGRYYAEQAEQYDSFDLEHVSRSKYIMKINNLIAENFKNRGSIDHVLDLACGTGRRSVRIREISGLDYHISGIDLSPDMCALARDRGVNAKAGNWLDINIESEKFDAVTFLYAYGHIPTETERAAYLRKIWEVLKPGGVLFLDVFNLHDSHEWGPRALQQFNKMNLSQFGYEKGDVFYKKTGGDEMAFLHYCEESGMTELLESNGFEVEDVRHIGYVYRSGEELKNEDEGVLFIKARKN